MAINFENTRQIVLFEIDSAHPHDINAFMRTVSQAIAAGTIHVDEFEQVVGMYKNVVSVAYCLSQRAYDELLPRIERHLVGQTEVYHYDFDTFELRSTVWKDEEAGWMTVAQPWCIGRGFGLLPPADVDGWTFFPSCGLYFVLFGEER
jgi:hypothetical protein